MADKEKAATGEATEEAAEETKESKIAPKPEGFVSPYKFAEALSEHLGRPIRPQTVYAQVRNRPKLKDGTEFPVETNSDGHYMVNLEAGLAWHDARNKERAEAKAAKTQKEEAAAEAEASE